MRCVVELLADFHNVKTVSISVANPSQTDKRRNSTQILRLFLPDSVSSSDNIVTVVVKGIELPLPLVEALVSEFLAKRLRNNAPYEREIDDLLASMPQARKSKMNSTLSSNPPSTI